MRTAAAFNYAFFLNLCFKTTQHRHLLNASRTSSVVLTTAALTSVDDVTKLMTVQMDLMSTNAVINL